MSAHTGTGRPEHIIGSQAFESLGVVQDHVHRFQDSHDLEIICRSSFGCRLECTTQYCWQSWQAFGKPSGPLFHAHVSQHHGHCEVKPNPGSHWAPHQ